MEAVSYRLKNVILSTIGPGWLQQALRIRWGLVLLLAIVLVLVMGESGPAASAITAQP